MFFWNRWKKAQDEIEFLRASRSETSLYNAKLREKLDVQKGTIEDLNIVIAKLRGELAEANGMRANEATVTEQYAASVKVFHSRLDRIKSRIIKYAPADLKVMSNRKLQAELALARDVITDVDSITKETE